MQAESVFTTRSGGVNVGILGKERFAKGSKRRVQVSLKWFDGSR